HRFLPRLHLDHLQYLEALIARVGGRIETALAPFADAAGRLATIPGVSERTAEVLVAEVGADMNQFPTSRHLASWAGMCPGNDESAGKRRSGRTTRGSRWLRTALVQAAWAASRSKGTYLSAQFKRVSARRGAKRAAMAVGHTLLVIAYHVLKRGSSYAELGADYLDRLEPERLTKRLVRRLEQLGHKVKLEPAGAGA